MHVLHEKNLVIGSAACWPRAADKEFWSVAEKDLKENPFRDEIFAHLLAEGYVEGRKADYDYKHALDTGRLFEFLAATQQEELKKLQDFYKTAWKQKYLELLCRKIDERGLLAALNEWVEDYPSDAKFRLVYFKSSLQAMMKRLHFLPV